MKKRKKHTAEFKTKVVLEVGLSADIDAPAVAANHAYFTGNDQTILTKNYAEIVTADGETNFYKISSTIATP
jgi:galactose mutarotase-like enzyme